jgi:hypothetical protein
MTYERPAVERTIPVTGPLITAPTAGSAPITTPTWTSDDASN